MIYIVLRGGEVIFATAIEGYMIEFLRRNPEITCVCARRDGTVGPTLERTQLMSRRDFGLD